jgi:hypothetical protein
MSGSLQVSHLQLYAVKHSHFTTLGDRDVGDGPVIMVHPREFNLFDDVHAFDDSPEDDVFTVEVGGGHGSYEELATIRVGTTVLGKTSAKSEVPQAPESGGGLIAAGKRQWTYRHGEQARLVML